MAAQWLKEYYSWILCQRHASLLQRIYCRFFGLPLLGKFFRLRIMRQFLAGELSSGSCAIDLGCGLGELSLLLAAGGATVTAVDRQAASLGYLQRYAASRGLSVKTHCADLEQEGTFSSVVYDLVVCVAVLDYVRKPQEFLAKAAAMAREGGTLYLGFPLATRKVHCPYEQLTGTVRQHNGFSKDQMYAWCSENGLAVVQERTYLPGNLFYHFSRSSAWLIRRGCPVSCADALAYPFFLLGAVLLQGLAAAYGTEVIVKLRKHAVPCA